MNIANFNRLADERLDKCKEVLVRKNQEYASDTDKLSNFKQAAALKNETPERALWGMQAKHIISLKKIIEDVDQCKLPSLELLTEKITDNINYLILLEALITERIEREKTQAKREIRFAGPTVYSLNTKNENDMVAY